MGRVDIATDHTPPTSTPDRHSRTLLWRGTDSCNCPSPSPQQVAEYLSVLHAKKDINLE